MTARPAGHLTTAQLYELDQACRLVTVALGMRRVLAGGGDGTPWTSG